MEKQTSETVKEPPRMHTRNQENKRSGKLKTRGRGTASTQLDQTRINKKRQERRERRWETDVEWVDAKENQVEKQ